MSPQVPHLDGRMASSLNMGHRGTLGNALLSVVSLADAAATPHHGQYFYVPLVSEQTEAVCMGYCGLHCQRSRSQLGCSSPGSYSPSSSITLLSPRVGPT